MQRGKKSLASLMREYRGSGGNFPMVGVDGYAGEQDGTTVVLAEFRCRRLTDAKDVEVSSCFKFHWLQYRPKEGWVGAIGCWSNESSEEVWRPLLPFVERL